MKLLQLYSIIIMSSCHIDSGSNEILPSTEVAFRLSYKQTVENWTLLSVCAVYCGPRSSAGVNQRDSAEAMKNEVHKLSICLNG